MVSTRTPQEMELIARLCREDQEFERLWNEHQAFDRRVTELEGLPHRTPEEELELKRIKKLKLLDKDKIEARLRSSQGNHAVSLPGR